MGDVEKKQYHKELLSAYQGPRLERERLDAYEAEKFYKVRDPGTVSKEFFSCGGSLKVKWTRVPDLVERRKVFLKGGWAYVPAREQSSIVFQEFEDHLEKALEVRIITWPCITITRVSHR